MVSHGICPACVSNLTFQQGVSLHQFLDDFELPVLVVDGDVQVTDANAAACRVLGKEADELRGHRGGEVFECAHARLPGGCGRTLHCSGCAIRRSVTTTYRTGEPQSMVPASLSRGDPDDPSSIALSITTVKVGDLVLLRVERMT